MFYILLICVVVLILFFLMRVFVKSDGRLLAKGSKYEKENRLDDAYLCYESAVRMDPSNMYARWKLAGIAYKRGAYRRAVTEYQALLAAKSFPEQVREHDVHYSLGRAYLALGSQSNAFIEFYRTLERSPEHPGANTYMGVIYAGQQKYDEALKHLKRAITADPKNGDAFYYTGLLLAEKGEFKAASTALEKASSLAPDRVEASFYLGLFYKDRNMLIDAIRRFQKVVNKATDPEIKMEGYRLLGMCYKERGLVDEAITHYEVAANQTGDPERKKDILYNLGMAYTKQGNADKAMATWQDIEKVDGSYKDVHELIIKGKRGFDMQSFDNALKSWERIVTKEGARLKGSGILRSEKRFDIDRIVQQLGGALVGGVGEAPRGSGKSIIEKFLELNNKQFALLCQRILSVLGFTVERGVSSGEDSDFADGKALAFVAERKDPKSRKRKKYLVQIRRWRENVGPIPIGNCLDMMQELDIDNGLFFVSSLFTEAAIKVANRDGRIQLVDRRGMIKVLKKVMR